MPSWSTEASIDFLKKWSFDGVWVLTAIIPDGSTETVSFKAEDHADAYTWIEERQGKKNIYFHVNPTRTLLKRKATKEDIKQLAWLHIDIDPRAGEDLEEERKRALSLLQNFDKRPTVIIDSGGGYQGFWKLLPEDRLVTDGSISKAQELEAYNIQLEKIFQADHCHNIDRIMRLPGTLNLPTKKKLRKGRVPVLASLVEWSNVAYPLSDFAPAVRVQSSAREAGLSGGQPKVKITGNVPTVGVEELRDWAAANSRTLSDHTLAVIATGEDPVDPTRYPSRSEALFKVCCDLVRADVPDDMIFAVITGSNEIASSVREKSNWESYALRQIERAHEEAIDPMLRYLNEKHAVISDIGGKCRIISEVEDRSMNRTRLSKQSFEDFRNRYRHIKVTVGVGKDGRPIEKAAGAFWIDHPNRRQYETIVFAPGQEIDNAYNLWRGFSCDSLPGDKHESFLAHIRENVCSGMEDHYNYLIRWIAAMFQNPDSPGQVAVVLRGKRGTGKSFFARILGKLLGRHYLQVSDSKHLVGSFNAHLRDTVLLFGDEAFFAGDKKHESVLKTLITEEHLVVEGKHVDAEAAPNYVHLILASNEEWVVPAGLDERRFFVLEVGESCKEKHNYFLRILEDLENGGFSNLLNYFLNYDLSDFQVRRVPHTRALMQQKILSMSPQVNWFYEKLDEGLLLENHEKWETRILKNTLYADYVNYMKTHGRYTKMTKQGFKEFLSRAMPKDYPEERQETCDVTVWDPVHLIEIPQRKRAYVLYIPDLFQLRQHWDKEMGGPHEWTPIQVQDEAFVDDDSPPF